MHPLLRRIQFMAAAVVFAGGAHLSALPVAAAGAEPCDCYERFEAAWLQQGECNAQSNPPSSILCAYIIECWTDIWGHLHYFGGCEEHAPNECPPIQPGGGCQP
jgi:hypothetical protein